MKLNLQNKLLPSQDSSDVLVLILDQNALTQAHDYLPASIQEQLNTNIARAQFKAKLGDSLPIYQLQGADFNQVLLVGAGELDKLNAGQSQTLANTIYKALSNRVKNAVISLDALNDQNIEPFVLALSNAAYRFEVYKSKKSETVLEHITLHSTRADELRSRIDYLQAVYKGQSLARDVANHPGNICHPEYMAEQAQQLAAQYPELLKVTVLDEAAMQELGMNALLAVSRGSEREARLVLLEYAGKKGQGKQDQSKPVVLVGKGITFDTGGISIKPAAGMDEMKFDMGGAASVLGTLQALCEARLPVNVVGTMVCAENMPSGRATRPGDVVTTMSGQTVEILNTDAEGRLVLCDALTYIKRFEPDTVIDIATLTGACVVALGKVVAGLFSPDDELANQLLQAGQTAHDRVWRMPVLDDYQELLDSPIADMGNIGGPYGGAITAACFLQRFTKEYRWAHLDIAGVAWISGSNKGATGRPVPLLMQFLRDRAHTA
ncbi:leucyl aminopeptidase [Alkanindiges sp. WGS2144]|uniref:leucyl aminopeptidase n=1 Tax=Alkanindiges sp. WGS2144 TaxID=3366808 RepID=UPI0037528344